MKRNVIVSLVIAGAMGTAMFGQQYPPQNDPYYNGQYNNGGYNDPNYDPNYNQGVYAPAPPPPPSYAYRQPPMPGPGYYWIDGYWNYVGGRYAWVGGYWAQPPYAGGYWVAPRYNGGRFFLGFWGNRGGVSLSFGGGGYYNNRPYVQNRVIIQAPRQVYRGNGGGNYNRGNGNRGGGNRGGGRH